MRVTLRPGLQLTHPSHFKALTPGDELTLSGKPVVVVSYIDGGGDLVYVDKGESTRKSLDVRSECWQWEPGEKPGSHCDLGWTRPSSEYEEGTI